jgi:hypothetical protein
VRPHNTPLTPCLLKFPGTTKDQVLHEHGRCAHRVPVNVRGGDCDENIALHSGGVMMLTRRSGIHLDTHHPSCPPTVGTPLFGRSQSRFCRCLLKLLPLMPQPQRSGKATSPRSPRFATLRRIGQRPRACYSAFSITQGGVKCGSISWRSEPPRSRGAISAVDVCYTANISTADGVEGLVGMPGCRLAGVEVSFSKPFHLPSSSKSHFPFARSSVCIKPHRSRCLRFPTSQNLYMLKGSRQPMQL